MAELTTEAVAGLLKGTTVLVPKTNPRTKAPIVKDGRFETEERPITAADILSFAERDGKVAAVTVDGRKHEVVKK